MLKLQNDSQCFVQPLVNWLQILKANQITHLTILSLNSEFLGSGNSHTTKKLIIRMLKINKRVENNENHPIEII